MVSVEGMVPVAGTVQVADTVPVAGTVPVEGRKWNDFNVNDFRTDLAASVL